MRRFLAAVASVLVVGAVHAAVVERLSLDELLRRSTVVSVVEVTETSASWRDGRIVTTVHARSTRAAKGARAGDRLEWFVEGGVVGEIGMRVPGEPTFSPGDRALVFLSPAAGSLRVTGMSQGVAVVSGARGAEMLSPPPGGATLVARDRAGRFVPAAAWLPSPRPLAEVLRVLDERARR